MNRAKTLCNPSRKNGTKRRISFLLTAAIATLIFSCKELQDKNETSADSTNVSGEPVIQQQKPVDKTVLAGAWIRTDADYRIEISELADEGKMEARYFNPKPINVAQARWTTEEEMMKIFIELRDVNYPGSNYNLVYIPVRNILVGEYYQAVEGATYKVEFKKAK